MISKNATFNILNFSFPAACVTDHLSGLKKNHLFLMTCKKAKQTLQNITKNHYSQYYLLAKLRFFKAFRTVSTFEFVEKT